MIRKTKQVINQRARQKRENLAMILRTLPFRLERDHVCHPSMMDVCKVKEYSEDGLFALIYSASALWGKKYTQSVPVSELRAATIQEQQTGLRAD